MPRKPRGTRDQIIRCHQEIRKHLDVIVTRLRQINDYADGGSPWIDEQLPLLVGAVKALEDAFDIFREGL